MKRLLQVIFLAIIVDFYVFPISFTFIPPSINSKMIVAAFGLLAFAYNCIREKSVYFSPRTIVAAILAVVFSLWCYFSIIANGTDDITYVIYWRSFVTWMGGAYGVYVLLRSVEKKADLAILSKYLLIVGVAQCFFAIMIDNIPAFQRLVDQIFVQGADFMRKNNRLYGIGCALDSGGIRLAVILVLTGYQMVHNDEIRNKVTLLAKYLTGFIIVTVIGSMIARTTTVGALMAIAYIVFTNAAVKRGGFISSQQAWFFALLIILVFVFIAAGTSLYNSSPTVREYLRFGFEGFFNLAETGEFRTSSTDILMEKMWMWPTDPRGWAIGYGRYGVMNWGTDIGYCNFTLYCGLIGLAIFFSYIIYSFLSLNNKFKDFYLLSMLLIALQAIIWAKVATDIFFVAALMFCIDGDNLKEIPAETFQE